MFKFRLIQNQRGMSLIEIMIATSMAIALSVGVMKVNQTASKGVAASKASASVVELEAMLKRKLSSAENANETFYRVGSGAGNKFNGGGGLDVTSNVTTSMTMIKTPFSSGDPEIEEGKVVPDFPEWKVISIDMLAFNNGNASSSVVGFCNIEIVLERVGSKNYSGAKNRKITIPMTCEVNNTTSKRLSNLYSTGEEDADELYWKRNEVSGDPTPSNNYLYLEHPGIGGEAKVKVGIGGGVSGPSVLAALTVDPGASQQDPHGSSARLGIHLPTNASILFGDASTTSSANLYYGTSGSNTLDSDGSFQAVNNVGAATMSATTATFTTANIATIQGNLIRGNGVDKVNQIFVDKIGSSTIPASQIWATNVNGSLTTPSDERFKKEITEIESASDALSQVRAVSYYMRKDEFPTRGFDDKIHYGVIAQEIIQLFPNLVRGSEEEFYAVNYVEFVPLLIRAHQEHSQQIRDNLEKYMLMNNGFSRKIASIEAKNLELESRVQKLEAQNEALLNELSEIKKMLLDMKKD